jgi:hypothetical protein
MLFIMYLTLGSSFGWEQRRRTRVSLFAVNGVVTSIGQSEFNSTEQVYAYIEITEPSGRRVMIEKVVVLNDVGAIFGLDLTGEFFVDRIFHSGKVRCQLWGIKTHDREILDRRNARLQWASAQLFLGLITTPLFGFGLLFIIPALVRLFTCTPRQRQQMFYGSEVPRHHPLQEQVMRI